MATFLAAVAGTAVVGERLAARTLEQQLEQRLVAARDRAALAIEEHVDQTRATLAGLAADPRTVAAFRRLRRATHDLDADAATAPRSMAPRRALVRSYLRRYYADELRRNALRLDSLLVPHAAAIWLQAAFFAGREEETDAASLALDGFESESLYETENEIWHPIFEDLVARFGWQDLLLADVVDGRILYSVSKTPVFQTSLVEGPYSESGLGSLFRDLRDGSQGATRWTDFAPFLPAHGHPVAFAGAPIFDGTTRIGVLLVEEKQDRLRQVLSANRRWSAVGLGETGDLFVVGSDSRLRSHPRFFERSRVTDPKAKRQGPDVVTVAESIPDPGETNAKPLRYVNHRDAAVLGVARRLEIPELSWIVVAEIEEDEAFAPLGRFRQSLGLVALWLFVVGAVAAMLVVKWMRRPLRQVLETLRAVRDGDSAARVPLRTAGDLGALGEAVNELIESHAEWIRQEGAERLQRETEIHELMLVLKAFARGDFSQRARVDGHLAGLANAVNAMGTSVGQLTDRLCVVPPRVAETSYGMQTVADQILQDAERQAEQLASAGMVVTEILAWLRGCSVDATGVVDAAARVEQMGQVTGGSGNLRLSDGGQEEDRSRAAGESQAESGASGASSPVTTRYQGLRTAIDDGEQVREALRSATDVARRIRTASEALRGHVQTLQLLALNLHAQGTAGRGIGPNSAHDSRPRDDGAGSQSTVPRV